MKLVTAIATVAAIAVPTLAAADDVKHVKYACDGNNILEVVFVNSDKASTAVMLQSEELVPMKQAKSGSGVRYVPISKDYNYELAGKGNEMTLYTGDKPLLTNCKS